MRDTHRILGGTVGDTRRVPGRPPETGALLGPYAHWGRVNLGEFHQGEILG